MYRRPPKENLNKQKATKFILLINKQKQKAHELGYQVVFGRKGQFKGYKGHPAIIYTRFLESIASGIAMPDYYEYIKTVDPDKFYNFIY